MILGQKVKRSLAKTQVFQKSVQFIKAILSVYTRWQIVICSLSYIPIEQIDRYFNWNPFSGQFVFGVFFPSHSIYAFQN